MRRRTKIPITPAIRQTFSIATQWLRSLKIQLASEPGVLPEYDEALLLRELNLFPDWYLGRHLQVVPDAKQKTELERVFKQIVDNNLAQPECSCTATIIRVT